MPADSTFGFPALQLGLRRLTAGLNSVLPDALKDSALIIEHAAKDNIRHGRAEWPAIKHPERRVSRISRSQATPLLDTGRLMRDIHTEADATVAVIGNSVVYAPPHEFGGAWTVPVTDKMRRYLHATGIHLKTATTTLHIKVPKRAYLEPAARENLDRIRQAFLRRIRDVRVA